MGNCLKKAGMGGGGWGVWVICRFKGWLDEKEEFFWGGGWKRGRGWNPNAHCALCLHSKPPATVDASVEGLFLNVDYLENQHHNFI